MNNIISYEDFIHRRLLEKANYEFGCVMLGLQIPRLGDIEDLFDQEDLCEPKFEKESHVTVLYGIKDVYGMPDMTMLLAKLRSIHYDGQPIVLDEVSLFSSDKYDIVKFSAESNEFVYEMNKELSKSVQYEESPYDFKPHCTIAYVKPGLGDKYVSKIKSLGLTPIKCKPTYLIYSNPSKQRTQLFLR